MGVKHPCYDDTNTPEVLTVDFLVTLQNDGDDRLSHQGVMVINSKRISKAFLLKLDIINCYLQIELNTASIQIFTERETSSNILEGFNWVSRAYETSAIEFPGINLKKIQQRIVEEISSGNSNPINEACKAIDKKLCYPIGSSLRICRGMLAHDILTTDYFSQPIGESEPLSRLSFNSDSEFLS